MRHRASTSTDQHALGKREAAAEGVIHEIADTYGWRTRDVVDGAVGASSGNLAVQLGTLVLQPFISSDSPHSMFVVLELDPHESAWAGARFIDLDSTVVVRVLRQRRSGHLVDERHAQLDARRHALGTPQHDLISWVADLMQELRQDTQLGVKSA